MKRGILGIFLALLFFIFATPTHAQGIQIETPIAEAEATSSAENATPSATTRPPIRISQEDLTRPEALQARNEFLTLFNQRPINEPDFTNFMGFTVQYAVRSDVPANTIILILLLPVLATLVVFFRQIIGIPTLEMLVPIALSITLVATGLGVGAILLITILFASIVSRFILKRIRIMQLPKMAISMLIVSLFVFAALVIGASLQIFDVREVSFLPVLLLILLSDKVVALQLARGSRPAIVITFFTLILGGIGFAILSYNPLRNYLLLYPEAILLLIPINIVFGRYFGLRLTEFYRFQAFRKYVD